jgi:hypothetical protein
VIFGTEASVTPLPGTERTLVTRALNAIAEWRLVKEGAATYAQLGYDDGVGHVPIMKLREFLVISQLYAEAEREKPNG